METRRLLNSSLTNNGKIEPLKNLSLEPTTTISPNASTKASFNTTASDEIDIDISIGWEEILLVSLLCLFIVVTVIGNTLVILAVITTRRLRTVTNCFVTSLAVADWLVGIFVMPPAIAHHLMGTWELGSILCDIWISLDVLLCTASILSLCAISIDRYLAVTQPLNYSKRRRSKRLALTMIMIVWVLALLITCPPFLGWYEPGRRDLKVCRYNQNTGYVIFSAMGSFFIPMSVMVYVYIKISCVIAGRHDEMSEIKDHKRAIKKTNERNLDNVFNHDISEQDQSSATPARSSHQNSMDNVSKSTGNVLGDLEFENTKLHQQSLNKSDHFELIDKTVWLNHSLKRNATVNYKPTSDDRWSAIENQYPRHHHSVKNLNTAKEFCSNKNLRVHQKLISRQITSSKRENKTTRTLSIVVGGFIACWLPFFICYLIRPILSHPDISEILIWLGWLNSAINPFIYAFYSEDFRAAFWRLTLKRFSKPTKNPPFSANIVSIRRSR